MLSLKQNIYGRDALRSSRKFVSTLSPIVTPTILNHQLPNSEGIDEDESEDNGNNELDFSHLLPESLDKKTLRTEDFLEHEENVEESLANQQNRLEDKIVDLRSLSHHIKIPDINELQGVSKHNCSCSRHATFSHGSQSTYSQRPNGYIGTTLSYPFMPIYLPSYQHYFHYLPSFVMDYTEPSLNYVYDDDNNDDGVESNSEEEEDHTHSAKPTKRRKKKNKCRAEQENLFKIEYDLLPRPTTIKERTTVEDNKSKSKQLLSDILTGLSLGFLAVQKLVRKKVIK
ncbi:unnamed protein product [Arctia plantaginis]|uniref:Uncharacterized protein n=1 Tax=Arctia plantaginis TaxID=874455 RepID=A0A8S0ZUJ7_ARCPL|nr:unnamed protein product [Arctia plantaginis]